MQWALLSLVYDNDIFSFIQYNIYLGPYGTGPDVAMHGEMKDVSPASVQSCNA